MARRLVTLVLLSLVGASAPAAAHFEITSPTQGDSLEAGSIVVVHIDVLVHHDPGETFDIFLVDAGRIRFELASGIDDTEFPYAVMVPVVDASDATLSMIQHGPEGYQYEQHVEVRIVRTGGGR